MSFLMSHDYLQQQSKSTKGEIDLSELWCIGPDFEKQTVFNLLSDNNYIEPSFTSSWWTPSPSRWDHALMPESHVLYSTICNE
ncbi:hypothetical protein I4U23_018530 [Adineta vaga]|nr:hypothetical protein I4U23_018530 [Adineta vaga]